MLTNSRLCHAVAAILLLLLLPAAGSAQEVSLADTLHRLPADDDAWTGLPDAAEPLVPPISAPVSDGLLLPPLPQLQDPAATSLATYPTQRLSPEAIKAMTLDPLDLQLNAAMPRPRFSVDPKATDYSRSGLLASWRTGYVEAAGAQQTMIGLMTIRGASFSATQVAGRWVFTTTASANHYHYGFGKQWQLGVGASATYVFSPNVSATVFGNIYTSTTFAGLATMPYMNSSNFGGFLTLKNEKVGIDLGVERVFNPYTGRWETVPIVTPSVRIANKFTISLPVGYLIKDAIGGSVKGKRPSGNGIIAPEIPAINPRFTQPPGMHNNW